MQTDCGHKQGVDRLPSDYQLLVITTLIESLALARPATLLHRLRQAVRDVLRGFRLIPLQMADQPRMVIEHAEQDRCVPFAARRQHPRFRGGRLLREPWWQSQCQSPFTYSAS